MGALHIILVELQRLAWLVHSNYQLYLYHVFLSPLIYLFDCGIEAGNVFEVHVHDVVRGKHEFPLDQPLPEDILLPSFFMLE